MKWTFWRLQQQQKRQTWRDLVTEEHSSPEDPLVNLTKAPIPNIPESQVGQSIKTKVDVSNVRNSDTSKMNVQLINPHKMKAQDQRSLKTTHTPTQAQTFNPNADQFCKPQFCLHIMIKL